MSIITHDEYLALCYKPCAHHKFATKEAAWEFYHKARVEQNRSVGFPDWSKETNTFTIYELWKTAKDYM